MVSRLLAAGALAAVLCAPAFGATVGSSRITGTVEHVSTSNIKVKDASSGQSLSFLITPKFKNVFSGNGNETYEMAKIKAGDRVTVYYDQKALGARHADRIVDLSAGAKMKT